MKPPASASPKLRIAVVTAAPALHGAVPDQACRADVLRTGLLDSGYDIVASLPADACLPEHIAQLQPDLIIADSADGALAVLDAIVSATRGAPLPIVLFTDDDAPGSMDAALAAGVTAYIVAGLQAARVKPVLDVALARFRREQRLLGELSETRQKLAERKVVERAKGVLMGHHKLSEEQAWQKLRSMAMNKNLKLADIAQRILDVEDLLG